MSLDPVKDPLYRWKKHSGFKKGLLTDIVLGDEHIGKTEYTTTMETDFKQKVLEIDGKTAGRFSGVFISDKGQKHIMFGDLKMQENDRLDSVTKVTFKPPQIEKQVVEKNEESKSIREKFHSKISTATSAAHFGSQTRQDLPIDDHHFTLRNFNTTTNDSYRLIPQTDSNRVIYGPKRSQLYFGDLGRAHNYDTVHHTSFIKHETKPIKLKKLEHRQSAIFNSKNYANDSESLYATTLSDAYKGAQLSKSEKTFNTIVNQKTGTSNIQFGQSKDKVKSSETSVTKRDYGIHPTHHVILRNPSSIRSHGIQKAMQPSDEPFQDGLHYIEPSEESTIDMSDYEPAGISWTKGLQTVKNQSSVPEGDIRYYNTSSTKSTSKEDFVQYPLTKVIAIGPSEVPTKYRIFNHDVDTKTNFQTTSQTEYVEYSKEDTQLVRSAPFKPSPVSNHKLGDEAIVKGEFKTTQHSHFCAPINASRRFPQLPQLALPNRLFPLNKNPNSFQTSSAMIA